jgi:NifU-like protein involved in Fe-S cluster formation
VSASTPYPPELVRWARDVSRRGFADRASPERRLLSGVARNRSCGDAVEVRLTVGVDGRVLEARHDGEACALALASSAALCAALEGLTVEGVSAHLAACLDAVVRGQAGTDAAFSPFVSAHAWPARHRCVTLPLEAVSLALPTPPR